MDRSTSGGAGPSSYGAGPSQDRSGDIFFQQRLLAMYNDRLRSAVQTILNSLSNEVPADHILLQLMSDVNTAPFVKCRVAEVVEGSLSSLLNQQCQALLVDVAHRDTEIAKLQGYIQLLQQHVPHHIASSLEDQARESTGSATHGHASTTHRTAAGAGGSQSRDASVDSISGARLSATHRPDVDVAALTATKARLESEVRQWEAHVSHLNKEMDRLKAELDTVEKDRHHLKGELRRATVAKEEYSATTQSESHLKQRIQQLEAKLTNTEADRQIASHEAMLAKEKASTLEDEIARLRPKLQESLDEAAALRRTQEADRRTGKEREAHIVEATEAAEARYRDSLKQWQEKATGANAECKRLQLELDELKENARAQEQRALTLERELNQQVSLVDVVQEQLNNIKRRLADEVPRAIQRTLVKQQSASPTSTAMQQRKLRSILQHFEGLRTVLHYQRELNADGQPFQVVCSVAKAAMDLLPQMVPLLEDALVHHSTAASKAQEVATKTMSEVDRAIMPLLAAAEASIAAGSRSFDNNRRRQELQHTTSRTADASRSYIEGEDDSNNMSIEQQTQQHQPSVELGMLSTIVEISEELVEHASMVRSSCTSVERSEKALTQISEDRNELQNTVNSLKATVEQQQAQLIESEKLLAHGDQADAEDADVSPRMSHRPTKPTATPPQRRASPARRVIIGGEARRPDFEETSPSSGRSDDAQPSAQPIIVDNSEQINGVMECLRLMQDRITVTLSLHR